MALDHVHRHLFDSDPNPRVACVLAKGEQLISMGATQPIGGPHAEVVALQQAQGQSLQEATAYVTLEPCCHYGRTPPCTQALIHSGIQRIVVATLDPNPLVAGKGVAQLRAAGLTVTVGLCQTQAREVNIGFFSRQQTQRPWLRAKMAASLDGFSALPNGQSQWITGSAARRDGHYWRARSSMVLTGIGTVLADNPQLNVRELPTKRQPLIGVVDSHFRIPEKAQIIRPGTTVFTLPLHNSDQHQKRDRLQGLGVQVVEISTPAHLPPTSDHLHLPSLFHYLGTQPINEVHLEAGPHLTAACLNAGLVDELLIYQSPKILGAGQAMLPILPPSTLSEQAIFSYVDHQVFTPDWRLRLRNQIRADKILFSTL